MQYFASESGHSVTLTSVNFGSKNSPQVYSSSDEHWQQLRDSAMAIMKRSINMVNTMTIFSIFSMRHVDFFLKATGWVRILLFPYLKNLLQIPPKMPVILTQYLGSDNVLHGKERRRSLLVRSSLQRMSTAESHWQHDKLLTKCQCIAKLLVSVTREKAHSPGAVTEMNRLIL